MNWYQWVKNSYIRLNKSFKNTYFTTNTIMRDVEKLLCYVVGVSREKFFAFSETLLTREQFSKLEILLCRREQGEPIAYLIGEQEFWSLNLLVSRDTFIPRCDTECLVTHVLKVISSDNAKILDLGTGTGAISLALAIEKPMWEITAIDYNLKALLIAKKNAAKFGIKNINFFCSRWFESLHSHKLYDLIVSNPPYISIREFYLLHKELFFEPRTSLISAKNGTADLEEICFLSKYYLVSGGWLILEHGYKQGYIVRSLLSRAMFKCILTIKDYGNNERVTQGRWI
ncbi:Release factor glutamine methyltransferase [Candidatus Westeberhardia cardiocondylae]|uniref:Release factor glutamine methyltransferase n=1 Tax=Candidatus Westeberhardia cardiocondylae TaxID=1594731 RepID=A0A0H5BX76_9ENTR|nr:peptide chain release factor N(5)-glutamine methyltransferase [Candidatus Westeberhardia cardiocondylae]CEN32234.1 Release factor glutamine methyltransferase [Candidatus Westeberhardia cardiocondylae]